MTRLFPLWSCDWRKNFPTGGSFRKCFQLSTHVGRVKHIAPADYRQGSHLRLLLQEMVTETADRILRRRSEERDNATVAAPTF